MKFEAAMTAVGHHLNRHWAVWLLASLLFFLAFPQVDLAVSGLFWQAEGGWIYKERQLLEFVRKGLPSLIIGGVLFAIILWVAGRIFRQTFLGIDGRVTLYLVLSLSIGPGLIVNSLFKDNWGRARPSQIVEFGGQAQYTPPFLMTDQCVSNCSFVSGHGALGFWLVALAFLAPAAWRGRAVAVALAAGSLVALVRIIQGGHFVSDTLYSAAVTITVSWLLWKWIIERRPQARPQA